MTLDSCVHICSEVRQKIFYLTVLGYTMPTILGEVIYETDSQTGICLLGSASKNKSEGNRSKQKKKMNGGGQLK